jgi:hypothetical protein
MEMQGDRRAIELGFDFVLDLSAGNEYATKVAGNTTSLAAPEANWSCPAQGRHTEALRA